MCNKLSKRFQRNMRYFRSLTIHVENAPAVFVSLQQNFVCGAQGKAFGIETDAETDIHSFSQKLLHKLRLASESVNNPRNRRIYLLMNLEKFGECLYTMDNHRLAQLLGYACHFGKQNHLLVHA